MNNISLVLNQAESSFANDQNPCIAINQKLVEDLRTLPKSLTNTKPFAFINLGLTEDDFKNIDNLNIDKTKEFTVFWKAKDFCSKFSIFNDFINSTSNSSSASAVSSIIYKIFSSRIEATWTNNDNQVVILLVRTTSNSENNPLHNQRTWHTDECYSANRECNDEFAFSFTLKGPSTLFYNEPSANIYDNNGIAKQPKDSDILSASPNQGVVFSLGDHSQGATHSVPLTNDARLFSIISLVNIEDAKNFIKQGDLFNITGDHQHFVDIDI